MGDENASSERYELMNDSWMLYNRNTTEDYSFHHMISVVVPILFSIIFIVGLTGNVLVVLIVCMNKKMMNTTNILILNLAIADMLFIVFCVPSTASDYMSVRNWLFGDLWCKTVYYLIHVTAYVSIYTLVLMSLDRFLAVVFPLQSVPLRTMKKTQNALIVTWIFALLLCLPTFSVYGEVAFAFHQETRALCIFTKDYDMFMTVQITFFVTSYLLPLVVICSLYTCILWKLWHMTPNIQTSREALQGKRRVTKMVTAVIIAFALCWLPIQIILVLKSCDMFISDSPVKVLLQMTANCLAYMNSCINPILYAFLSEKFRVLFRMYIRLKCRDLQEQDIALASLQNKCGSSVLEKVRLAPGKSQIDCYDGNTDALLTAVFQLASS